MELDDLKRSWHDYDRRLSESLRMNETLLRQMNLDRAKKEMNTPYSLAIFGVITTFLAVILLLGFTPRFIKSPSLLTCNILAIGFYLAAGIGAIWELKLFSKIDFYHTPVAELQKTLSKYKRFFFLSKKIGIFTLPLGLAVLNPIVCKLSIGMNIFSHPNLFLFSMVFSLGVSYPLVFWIWKQGYEKKIKNAESFLKELSEFEKEEPEHSETDKTPES